MIPSSIKAKRTFNPIRNIVDNLKPPCDHAKDFLNLALGDPTVYGNLQLPSVLADSVNESLREDSSQGYLASVGSVAARKAIAEYNHFIVKKEETIDGQHEEEYIINPDDVIMASGCSGAIELVLTAILNEGDNILVPTPCFPLYEVVANSLGASVKHYVLDPSKDWECNLQSMNDQVDAKTKAIFINNPSNPCGSNFSFSHLRKIAKVAAKHNLPIIADEIYARCVFNGEYYPMHAFSGDVPIISLGGIAKEFVVPGWRVGWLTLHDKGTGRLEELKKGIRSLTQIVLGCNSLIQAAIPRLLTPVSGSSDHQKVVAFKTRYMGILRENANLCVSAAANCPELTVIEPSGAMYAMVGIVVEKLDGSITDDTSFAKLLLEEQNLFVLPGQCFGMANYIRLVTCAPSDVLGEAFQRLEAFCVAHRADSEGNGSNIGSVLGKQGAANDANGGTNNGKKARK